MTACGWCGGPFTPNTLGRPRRYCSVQCRTDAGHYREDLPGWTARLAELEATATASDRVGLAVPAFVRNEMRHLRLAIGLQPDARG